LQRRKSVALQFVGLFFRNPKKEFREEIINRRIFWQVNLIFSIQVKNQFITMYYYGKYQGSSNETNPLGIEASVCNVCINSYAILPTWEDEVPTRKSNILFHLELNLTCIT
jgi:hypothetical protein